jgi:serine/threonine protein kinase
MLLGTPAYMPPEQALAKSSDIDAQTDVWAAGATLFTLVSGCTVHEGDNGQQLMVRAATAPARSLAAVAGDVPPQIVQVVDRALAFEKGGRWPSAAAMRDALEAARREALGPDYLPTKAHLAVLVEPSTLAMAPTENQLSPAPWPEGTDPDRAPAAGSAVSPLARSLQDDPPHAAAATQVVASAGSTARPVHGSAPPTLVRRTGRRTALVLGGTVVVVAGLLAMQRARRDPSTAIDVPSTASSPPRAAPPPAATPPDTATTAPSVAPSPSAASSASAAPVRPSRAPWDAGASAARTAAPVASAKAKPGCVPNYVLDSNGNKHFKPECFE